MQCGRAPAQRATLAGGPCWCAPLHGVCVCDAVCVACSSCEPSSDERVEWRGGGVLLPPRSTPEESKMEPRLVRDLVRGGGGLEAVRPRVPEAKTERVKAWRGEESGSRRATLSGAELAR